MRAQVVRRWEYGLLSDTSSVTYVQVPPDIKGGRFRFWDPREHDWSIIHRAQVPPPTREIATEARPSRPAVAALLCGLCMLLRCKCVRIAGVCRGLQCCCVQHWFFISGAYGL